jgi:hypothetical protein
MKRISVRNLLNAAALAGGSILAANAWAQPSQGNYGPGSNGMGPGMMGNDYGFGWMGGYGGIWVPILLVAAVVGVVVWVVAQKKK